MTSNICIVAPSIKMGGTERASATLANSFSDLNQNVLFISLFNQEKFFSLNRNIVFLEPINFNMSSLSLFKTIFWLRKELSKQPNYKIIVFNRFYSAITLLAVFGNKRDVFISERSSPIYKWKISMRIFSYLVFLFLKPTGVIAQTNIAASYQKKTYPQKTRICVIPNALRNVQLFPNVKRQNQILAVGRLKDHLKGFDRLIEAFSLVKNKDWKLVFAGGDEEGDHLKGIARKTGLLNRIEFLGKVKDIDHVYARAGIFVIPSRSEGFPNALCEAMAAGLPCISFDFIAGPRDIITHEQDGIIVENGNTDALAAAIDHFIENPKERERLGKNALKIRERLKLEKIGQEYLDFILGADNG